MYHRRPEEVGFRNRFWGREQEIRDAVEGQLSSVETHIPRLLNDLVSTGGPAHGSADRGLLLQFLAIHMVRNPAWRNVIGGNIERLIVARGHDAPEWAPLRDRLRADEYWVDAVLRQIPQIAGMLGSMQWALLRFPAPWLATCDQPVLPVALAPQGVRVPVHETPALLETVEFRFVVDPWHAVILSWHDAPDWKSWADADQHIAADINRSVVGRADVEYFHRRGVEPPFVAPPWLPTDECSPISTRLHADYWTGAAENSERRRRAAVMLRDAIDNDTTDQIRTVTVSAPSRNVASVG